MPTNSLEMMVTLIIEVNEDMDEEADNGIEKELDMNMGHKSYLAIKSCYLTP